MNGDAGKIDFAHIANSIGAYEAEAFRADDSPFDRYVRGYWNAMSSNAEKGPYVFNSGDRCASCHSGKFQTDRQFYSLGIPQIGPGKGDGLNGHDDFGREQVTGNPAGRYRFRTPTLRNVAITGPWGHDGAYNTLEGIVRHHMDAIDFEAHQDTATRAALADKQYRNRPDSDKRRRVA